MKFFHYLTTNKDNIEYIGEIGSIPQGFIESKITLSGLSVYYKIVEVKITEIIGEAIHETAARRRVDEFLSEFLATPFEPL
jgi:hypothetical protein